jgi:hypothetical protein
MAVDIRGSDIGPWMDAESDAVSPASLFVSLTVSLVAVLRRKFTTRFFFFRPDLECLPDPRVRPELRLTRDGLDGRSWLPASENV